MASIALYDLQKKYPGGNEAVKNINLMIEDREFAVLVGPSGCGKSTTLRMIAGLEEVSGGEILIGGRKVNDVCAKNRDIAMVFQNYALYPHMTVYKNMSFGMALRKTPKPEIERKVRETAKMLGIEELLNRKPKQLSGGERQRVAIGRAIVREPQAFLMDEPLSNLDAKLRAQMREEIAKLYQKLQTTFIYVTHDQIEAMTLGTKVIVMKDGVIQQTGAPADLYEKPANIFVAGFIGTPQMNFFEVEMKDGVLRLGEYRLKLPPDKASRVKNHERLTIGLRPKDIREGERDNQKVFAAVKRVERLGPETNLYLDIADTRCIATVPPDSAACAGELITVGLDMSKVHLFGPDGARI